MSYIREDIFVAQYSCLYLYSQIRTMIKEYIRNDATIILAVVPANVDIATTEALQMAREVDREGRRTLG